MEWNKAGKGLLGSSSLPHAIHTRGITPQQYRQLLKLLDKEENFNNPTTCFASNLISLMSIWPSEELILIQVVLITWLFYLIVLNFQKLMIILLTCHLPIAKTDSISDIKSIPVSSNFKLYKFYIFLISNSTSCPYQDLLQ